MKYNDTAVNLQIDRVVPRLIRNMEMFVFCLYRKIWFLLEIRVELETDFAYSIAKNRTYEKPVARSKMDNLF